MDTVGWLQSKVVVGVLGSALALGCSEGEQSSSNNNDGGSGAVTGGSGAGGTGALGGGPAGSGGASGASGASGGVAGNGEGGSGGMVPMNPLCPASGPIVAGSTPLPDGVEVASVETDAKFLAVSDTHAYWANDKLIRRISVADNTEEVIVDRSDTDFTIQGLAIDEDNVYFSEAGLIRPVPVLGVAKAPLDGSGEPTSIASEGPEATSSMGIITAADGYVYFFNNRTSEIARVSADGGDPTVMLREANPTTMIVAGGYLWFMHPRTNAIDNVNLLRVPVDAEAPPEGTPSEAVNVPPGAEAVAPVYNYGATGVSADADYLYYDDENKVMRVPIEGGTPEIITEAEDQSGFAGPETTYVNAIVPSTTGVLWEAGGSCGPILESAFDGSSTTNFIEAVRSPTLLSVNRTHLYFSAGGQILRAPLQ